MKNLWYDNIALAWVLKRKEISTWFWNSRFTDWLQRISADFSVWIYLHQSEKIAENNDKIQIVIEQQGGVLPPLPEAANDDSMFKPPIGDEDAPFELHDAVVEARQGQ